MAIDVELKRAYKTGKLDIGLKVAEESLLYGKSKGLVASRSANSRDIMRLENYAKISKVNLVFVEETPKEFGQLLGLSYPVSAVSILDEGKSKILQELGAK
jgi:ribosomal protein L30E